MNSIDKQVKIITNLLSCFKRKDQKLDYLAHYFAEDTEFCDEAIAAVREKIIADEV